MEQEIDKLQKLIDRCNECKFATCEQCEINWTEVQAIQNLIARYKKVEEDIKYVSEEKWKADEAVIFLTERLESALKDRVPKSKVQEKIEDLKDAIQYSANPLAIDNCKYAIEILQELIEN